MPNAATDELSALRALLWTAQSFLQRTADRMDLDAAVRECFRCKTNLSNEAFKRPASRVGGLGGVSLESSKPPRKPGPAGGTNGGQKQNGKGTPPEGRQTWLTPFYEAYKAVYGEAPPAAAIKRMARAFGKDGLGGIAAPAEVCRRFVTYLRATPPKFYSAEHFVDTFAAWKETDAMGDGTDPLPGEETDAYIARINRMYYK